MNILMVTRSNDNECATRVMEALEESGHRGFRWDTDLYPISSSVTSTYGLENDRRVVRTEQFELDLDQIGAVYFRRFDAGINLPNALGEFREACYEESVQAVCGFLASVPCFQLDPYWAIRRGELKECQIKLALEFGLKTPRTLFTNSADEVRRFAKEVGPIVAKAQTKTIIYRNQEDQAAFTTPVEDLDNIQGLEYSPAIFQEQIEKKLELRATVVGNQVFCAAIDSTRSEVGATDYRLDNDLSFGWKEWTLPHDVETSLIRVVQAFGLNYSAADIILTPDDEYIFLEINSAGEWVWLARDLGLPIADALVGVLTKPERRLVAHQEQW